MTVTDVAIIFVPIVEHGIHFSGLINAQCGDAVVIILTTYSKDRFFNHLRSVTENDIGGDGSFGNSDGVGFRLGIPFVVFCLRNDDVGGACFATCGECAGCFGGALRKILNDSGIGLRVFHTPQHVAVITLENIAIAGDSV